MAYLEFLKSTRGRVMDDLLVLKAKGTVATSMVGEDPVGTDTYVDVGHGRTTGDVVINVYAAPTMVPGSKITMRLQGSKNSSFTTGCDLQIFELGDSTQLTGASSLATADMTVGRYILPFTNDIDGTVYQYLRHYATMACIDESWCVRRGIQYEVYLSKLAE
jgi:hypothetical protein